MRPARGFWETYFCSEESPRKSLFFPKDVSKNLVNLIVAGSHPEATKGTSLRMKLWLAEQTNRRETCRSLKISSGHWPSNTEGPPTPELHFCKLRCLNTNLFNNFFNQFEFAFLLLQPKPP